MARRSLRSQAAEPAQLSSPPATPAPAVKKQNTKAKGTPKIKEEIPATPQPAQSRKRGRATSKSSPQDDDDLPHNLGRNGMPTPASDEHSPPAKKQRATPKKRTPIKSEPKDSSTPAKKARSSTKKTPIKADPAEMEKLAANAGIIPNPTKDSKSPAKKKANYRLTPGQSPYPTYPHPTKEECYEVSRLLSKAHGSVSAPKEIKAPSLTTAGCGEVPSVLDALVRTRLSAATTGTNSSRAFQGLVKTFGTVQRGVGRGSVHWGKVREAKVEEVFEAIKCGGLAGAKSKDIKEILDSVWEENLQRAKELKTEGEGPKGVKVESEGEKRREVAIVEEGVPSLDHLHLLSSEEAFNKLVSYPGIGPKTASCVLLFCLQRPSFAVDTHVFRLCKYLGWVPTDAKAKQEGWPRVERNTTYSHCEVMVPDELKYGLHQLLIKHGKQCGRCRAATGMGGEGWKKGCPIDHLVKRHGAKKGEFDEYDSEDDGTPKKRGRGSKAQDSESEEAEMSGLGSDSDDNAVSDVGSDDDE